MVATTPARRRRLLLAGALRHGMKYLIESFYRSIIHGTPVPIPYREILLTARIMEAIFDQLGERQSQMHFEVPVQDQMPLPTMLLQ